MIKVFHKSFLRKCRLYCKLLLRNRVKSVHSRPATECMSVIKIYDFKYLFKVKFFVELENTLMSWCKILIMHIMVCIFCIVAIGMLTSPFLEAIPRKYLGYCCNLREPLDQMGKRYMHQPRDQRTKVTGKVLYLSGLFWIYMYCFM